MDFQHIFDIFFYEFSKCNFISFFMLFYILQLLFFMIFLCTVLIPFSSSRQESIQGKVFKFVIQKISFIFKSLSFSFLLKSYDFERETSFFIQMLYQENMVMVLSFLQSACYYLTMISLSTMV